MMRCSKCGSDKVIITPVTRWKEKHRGCLGWFLWILLAILTCGLILIIPILTNTRLKSRTRTQAICQNCGKSWWL